MKNTFVLLLGWLILAGASAGGADWYVSPDGKPDNTGRKESPWDIATTLDGKRTVAAGDTVFLLPGTYKRRPKEQFDVRLVGTAEQPIHIRPAPGTRAIIDGGLAMQSPSAHVWVRDLEILVSEPTPETPVEPGSHPESFTRPWGGLHMFGGTACKYINLVIHDCRQGISCWKGEKDCEIYGCIIYGNGWLGTDRGHGHCIYTQNADGIKTYRHCILTCKYTGTQTVQAYGSKNAYVDNFLFDENVAYNLGRFLVGGGRPSHGIRVFGNILYKVDLQLGYDAPTNDDCEVRNNLIVNGTLNINRFQRVVNEGNRVISSERDRATGVEARWLPNKYDAKRATLVVFNWDNKAVVEIEAKPFVKKGDRFRVLDPKDFHGKPLHEGVCDGDKIMLAMSGDFGVFVVLR